MKLTPSSFFAGHFGVEFIGDARTGRLVQSNNRFINISVIYSSLFLYLVLLSSKVISNFRRSQKALFDFLLVTRSTPHIADIAIDQW